MNPDLWESAERLFHEALERPARERSAFVVEAAKDNPSLADEVLSLLAADAGTGQAFGTLSEPRAMHVAPGARLGPYEILSLLGAGGMGEVYKARDSRLDRTVAIKLLAPHVHQRRFLREARAVSALNHPNIVILYDIASHDGIDFLVLEYVPGTTLNEMIPRSGLDLGQVIDYGVQIADALGAAHAAGIVHRDIKPANIIVTPEFNIKILDFGIAKLSVQPRAPLFETLGTAAASATMPGVLIGTISYMSPEQTRGEPLDGRSDLFSLGCVLYQAATGEVPFGGDSALSTIHAIASKPAVPPSAINGNLPSEFDFVIERALAKDKNDRYGSALELAEALQTLRGQALPRVRRLPERDPAAIVGREGELRRLQDALRHAIEGSGTVVFLTGEAGTGKSALAESFLFCARRDHPDLLVARGACIEQYGAGEAYLPFLDALSVLLRRPERARVAAVLRRHAPTWCLQFPAVFGSASAFEQLQRQAIGATKERMLREFGDAVTALTAARPILLLLEDLHWSDPSSIDLLRHLAGRARRQPLLVVGTLRPDDVERSNQPLKKCARELRARDLCDEVPVRLLGQNDVARYLDVRFAPNEFPDDLAALIYRKTEGHALFSVALVQLLAERGDITSSGGRWQLVKRLTDESLAIPESVRGTIRNKIDALADDDRRVLQYASIQGEEFVSPILADMLETDELALEQRLDDIERSFRLVVPLGEEELPDGSVGVRYRFAHALYQSVLYDAVLARRRAVLHRQAGDHLSRRYGKQTARIAGPLAAHFERGRDFQRAIEFLIQAADVAMERYAGVVAAEHYTHALALADKMPPAETVQARLSLLRRRGSVALALGRLAEAKHDFDDMAALARVAGDLRAECAALNALANPFVSRYLGRHEEEMHRAEHALALAERTGDAATRAEAMINLALRHSLMGEPATARALFEAAVPLARAASDPSALLRTMTYRGIGHFFQTEFRDAETTLIEAADLASRLHDGAMLRTTLFFLAYTRASLGRISDALTTLNELLEMAKRNADTLFLARVPQRIAWIHRELMDSSYVVPDREPTTPDSAEMLSGDVNTVPIFSGVRFQARAAEAALAQGDLTGATEQARTLLRNSTRHGPPRYVAVAHRIRAEIAIARGDLATAEHEFVLALAPLRTHPAPLTEWKIHAALGRLYRQNADPDKARQAFKDAASIVNAIAENINDEPLRRTFLNAPAVEEVLRGTL